MATTILSLPLVQLTATTGTNEDWLDSLQYLESDEVTPVDISGIDFTMEVRRLITDADVVVTASIADGRLAVGGAGNSFLSIYVPMSIMKEVPPDEYVADIVATADGYTRVVVQITALTVFQGATR